MRDADEKVFASVTIAVLALLFAGALSGTGSPTSRWGTYQSVVESLLEEAKIGVEVVRGLGIDDIIRLELITSREAIERWAPKNDKHSRDLLLTEFLYKATFLLEPSENLSSLAKRWVGMFLAAAAGTTIYVNVDYFDPQSPDAVRVLVHELVHVAQYLHFKVAWPAKTDERNALAALIEGDAELVSDMYCLSTYRCRPGTQWSVDYSNPYISLNLFPYIFGKNFVKSLYDTGGWDLVNKAYERPPKSTLMVMVPEIYVAYLTEGITPEVSCSLRKPWASDLVDTLGAYYLLLVVGRLSDNRTAWSIAMGWRGDLATVDRNGDVRRLSWSLCFSSPEYAEAFESIVLARVLKNSARLVLTNTGFGAVFKLGNEWYELWLTADRKGNIDYLVYPAGGRVFDLHASLVRERTERLIPLLPVPS